MGAAALGIGGYAYHEHEKHKKERAEEEVSSLFQCSEFPQLTIVERMHCRLTLRHAPKGTTGAVLVALRPGFLSMDVITFLTRQSWPEGTKITIRSISHVPIMRIVSVSCWDRLYFWVPPDTLFHV